MTVEVSIRLKGLCEYSHPMFFMLNERVLKKFRGEPLAQTLVESSCYE